MHLAFMWKILRFSISININQSFYASNMGNICAFCNHISLATKSPTFWPNLIYFQYDFPHEIYCFYFIVCIFFTFCQFSTFAHTHTRCVIYTCNSFRNVIAEVSNEMKCNLVSNNRNVLFLRISSLISCTSLAIMVEFPCSCYFEISIQRKKFVTVGIS